jgi:adenylosuccinate synthase
MSAVAIVGAQYGSEGKGVVAAYLAWTAYARGGVPIDAAVRVGGPNAGHSFRVQDVAGGWTTYKMRGVPCAWISPETDLYIGAGAVVDRHLLARELKELPEPRTVFVDANAAVVTEADQAMEKAEGLRDAVGSTLEGVGQARINKIRRNTDRYPRAGDYDDWHPSIKVLSNVASRLYELWRAGGSIMLEGTQGAALSLDHTPCPPYSTSANATASSLLDQVGLPPAVLGGPGGHVFLVARTLPIRVAGNSGPMWGELSWDEIREHAGVEAPERTTVTNKIRRIGRWDQRLFVKAKELNEPCGVFLMFADYLVPEMAGTTDAGALLDAARPGHLGDLKAITATVEMTYRVPVVAYGTGGPGWALAFRSKCGHGVDWA